MDWLDLLTVQGTLKSLLQHHSSKASILQSSAFFIVQLSHPYMTTRKTIALTIQTFVPKWCLCFLMTDLAMSRFVIAFLPRSKCLNYIAAVTVCSDFEAQENKICHCFHFFPFYLLCSYETRCHDLSFWMLSFKLTFSLSSFTLNERLFSFSSLSVIREVSPVSEVDAISPGSLDSSLWFIQPRILMMYLHIR